MAKELALRINVDLKKLMPILAASYGDLSVLSESYGFLAEKL